jgi:hypothetical protein
MKVGAEPAPGHGWIGGMGWMNMSEPMSSGDIEDVLSSIRRLVSGDLRPAAALPADPQAAPVATEGKLLLTPSLRVVSTERAEDWLPETAEADSDLLWWAGEAPDRPEDSIEVAASVVRDVANPEAEADDTPVATPMAAAEAYVVEAVPVASPAADLKATDGLTQSAEIAAVTEIADAAPEAVPEADLVAQAARVSADAAEAAAVTEISDGEVDPDTDQSDAEGNDLYHESVLREVVRDLIREELGGRLGEQMTRNVRKLVRAEISRALTARDIG